MLMCKREGRGKTGLFLSQLFVVFATMACPSGDSKLELEPGSGHARTRRDFGAWWLSTTVMPIRGVCSAMTIPTGCTPCRRSL